MNLLIMGLEEAIEYTPINPTLSIRIISSRYRDIDDKYHLRDSVLYTKFEYEFDDVFPMNEREIASGYKLFDEDLATKIITDFQQNQKDKETLLVNCLRGQNRSPAVAIALNDIFVLGSNSKELKIKYSEANWYVYNVMVKTAKTLRV